MTERVFCPKMPNLIQSNENFKKLQITPLDFFNPGGVHLKAIQERALENEFPEAVQIVKRHEYHLLDVGIVDVEVLSPEGAGDLFKEHIHLIVQRHPLVYKPIGDAKALFLVSDLCISMGR